MLYNKHNVRKINDKKVLHKVGKHWVTLSIAMLATMGIGFAATGQAHHIAMPSVAVVAHAAGLQNIQQANLPSQVKQDTNISDQANGANDNTNKQLAKLSYTVNGPSTNKNYDGTSNLSLNPSYFKADNGNNNQYKTNLNNLVNPPSGYGFVNGNNQQITFDIILLLAHLQIILSICSCIS